MIRHLSLSLAAKCQLLFGLAVLLIIAGALAVPWQRMEQLASQQNIQAARTLADVTLRHIHQRPTTQPARWDLASLPEVIDYPQPRILMLPRPGGELPATDRVAGDALHRFQSRPSEWEYGRIFTQPNKSRTYRYAAAVRLDPVCLSCHAQYQSWLSNTSSVSSRLAGRPEEASRPLLGLIRVDLPVQVDENQLLLNRIVIVVAGMLGGTMAIVVFYLITNRLILQPVRVLRNTAAKVSQGDLNIRSAISTGDEFQHLAETFNTMLATLKASQDQLEATNRSLDTRVGELSKLNVDLYQSNRLKSEFLTNVTHELRTPLNAIIGFTELLAEDRMAKEAKIARYLENIRTSARQLLVLINDLLDLAKIEAGKLILRPEKVNIAEACEAMVNFMRPLAQKKSLPLAFCCESEIPLVTTDPGRFQQILYNFLSNAIKFTPNEGQVRLMARREPQEEFFRVSVSDTGPGIAPEDQQVIFEKFRQADASVTRQHGGSGLGLTISRELATLLGGRIELESELGKGSTFSLILPISHPGK